MGWPTGHTTPSVQDAGTPTSPSSPRRRRREKPDEAFYEPGPIFLLKALPRLFPNATSYCQPGPGRPESSGEVAVHWAHPIFFFSQYESPLQRPFLLGVQDGRLFGKSGRYLYFTNVREGQPVYARLAHRMLESMVGRLTPWGALVFTGPSLLLIDGRSGTPQSLDDFYLYADFVGNPLVPGSTVIVGLDDGRIHEYDRNLKRVWWTQVRPTPQQLALDRDDGALYVLSSSSKREADPYVVTKVAATGSVEWESRLVSARGLTVLSNGTPVLVGRWAPAPEGFLGVHALDPETGMPLWLWPRDSAGGVTFPGTWSIDHLKPWPRGGFVTVVQVKPSDEPAPGEDHAVATLWNVAADLSVRWSFAVPPLERWKDPEPYDQLIYDIAIGSDETVYVATTTCKVYALDGADGSVKWWWRAPNRPLDLLAYEDGVIAQLHPDPDFLECGEKHCEPQREPYDFTTTVFLGPP